MTVEAHHDGDPGPTGDLLGAKRPESGVFVFTDADGKEISLEEAVTRGLVHGVTVREDGTPQFDIDGPAEHRDPTGPNTRPIGDVNPVALMPTKDEPSERRGHVSFFKRPLVLGAAAAAVAVATGLTIRAASSHSDDGEPLGSKALPKPVATATATASAVASETSVGTPTTAETKGELDPKYYIKAKDIKSVDQLAKAVVSKLEAYQMSSDLSSGLRGEKPTPGDSRYLDGLLSESAVPSLRGMLEKNSAATADLRTMTAVVKLDSSDKSGPDYTLTITVDGQVDIVQGSLESGSVVLNIPVLFTDNAATTIPDAWRREGDTGNLHREKTIQATFVKEGDTWRLYEW